VKHDAGLINIDIDLVFRRPAPEDTREVEHSQNENQPQDNSKHGQSGAASPSIGMNVFFDDPIRHLYTSSAVPSDVLCFFTEVQQD
jgi:hypothetical protein